jgi:hypothetical protein
LRRALVLGALAAGLVLVPAALADGDPASDVLPGSDAFVPYDAGIPSESAAQLTTLLRNARTKKIPIKVALIRTTADLGSIPQLYGKPSQYAKFLGQEIDYTWRGPLLVVMPDGFGVYHGGKSTAKEERALEGLATAQVTGHDLALAAIPAVQRLAAPVRLTASKPPAAAPSSSSHDRVVLIVAAVAIAAVLAALLGGYGAWRRRGDAS